MWTLHRLGFTLRVIRVTAIEVILFVLWRDFRRFRDDFTVVLTCPYRLIASGNLFLSVSLDAAACDPDNEAKTDYSTENDAEDFPTTHLVFDFYSIWRIDINR